MASAIASPRTQTNYVLVHSRGPDVLRMYHSNITQNHRNRQVARIRMPAIVARATLLVEHRTLIPTASRKVTT